MSLSTKILCSAVHLQEVKEMLAEVGLERESGI